MSSHRRERSSSSRSGRTSFGGLSVRRWLVLLLGFWLGGIFIVTLGTPQTFRAIDSVMIGPPPEAARVIQTIGPATARLLLRYQIAEANRLMFQFWAGTQVALGIAVLLLVLFGTSSGRLALCAAAGMLLLAILMYFVMAPRLAAISRDLEFTPGTTTQKDTDRFQLLHRGFSAFEGGIALLGAGLLVGLFRGERRSERRPNNAVQ